MKNADKPAFPEIETVLDYDLNKQEDYENTHSEGGLTKREYFAAKAMQGNLANPDLLEVVTSGSILDGSAFDKIAEKSFYLADAMLAEGDKS